MYLIRIFNEGNNHFFPRTTLIITSTLQILISLATSTECLTEKKTWNINIHTKILLRRLRNFCKLSTFLNIKLERNKTVSIFVPHSWISQIKHV